MSTNTNRRRGIRGLVIAAAVAFASVGAILAFSGGSTGANFTSTAPVTAHADAGTLELSSTNALSFSKLVPGVPQSQALSFTNNGNVRGDALTIDNPVVITGWNVPNGKTPDWNQVYVTIPGYLPETKVTSITTPIGLGGLNPGQTRNFTVTLEVKSAGNNDAGDAKDNQFQGVSFDGTATGKLRTN